MSGVCYRTLGRIEEAETQFRLAVALNPQYMSAVFNLGLTLQQMSHWTDAIESYRQVNAAAAAFPDSVKPQMRLESQIRECDLLQGLQLTAQALVCWELGIDQFPTDGVIHNEIGTIYAKVCFRFCFNVLLIFFLSFFLRQTTWNRLLFISSPRWNRVTF
jgi:tetratricopeptide (TPR) repeat protein